MDVMFRKESLKKGIKRTCCIFKNIYSPLFVGTKFNFKYMVQTFFYGEVCVCGGGGGGSYE